ncbi:MAG: tetratricopeptide repeat protein [Bacteroidota bacterium]
MLIATAHFTFSQTVDSLKTTLTTATGRARSEVLIDLFEAYHQIDFDSAKYYGELALQQGIKNHDSLVISRAYYALAHLLRINGQFKKAEELYLKSLALSEIKHFLKPQKRAYNGLAMTNYYWGKFDECLKYHLKSLELRKENGDPIEIAISLNNIGLTYYQIQDYNYSLTYFKRVLALDANNQLDGIEGTYSNMGLVYKELGHYDSAQLFFQKVFHFCSQKKSCDQTTLVETQIGMGACFLEMKQFDKARKYYSIALNISEENDFKIKLPIIYRHLALLNIEIGDLELGKYYLQKSQKLVIEMNMRPWLSMNENLYAKIYSSLGDFENAYRYQKRYDSLQEVLIGFKVSSRIAAMEREAERKEKVLLREKETRALKSRNQLFVGSSAGIFILSSIAFFFYRSNRFRKRANQQISVTLEELKTTQDQLVAQEKMAALGQLVSGISHEINTPLGAIQGLIQPVNDYFAFVTSQLNQWLKVVPEDHHTLILELMKQYREGKPHFNAQEKRAVRKTLKNSLAEFRIEASKLTIEYLFDIGVTELNTSWEQILKLPNHEAIVKLIHSVVMHERSTSQMGSVVNKIAKMVSALQTYSQPERSAEVKVAIDLRENIDQVLVLLENQFKKGVQLIKNYPKTLAPIQGNPEALNQVWTNLLINAIQAVEGKGTVEVEIEETAQQITVSIKDDGYGINEEDKDNIFEAFYTTKKRGYGTGLGLNIAKKILEGHGGTISYELKSDSTIFIVSICNQSEYI